MLVAFLAIPLPAAPVPSAIATSRARSGAVPGSSVSTAAQPVAGPAVRTPTPCCTATPRATSAASSDDCNASGKSKLITMQPGDKVASSITWNGRLSQKGCPDGEGAAAKAGRYDLTGRNGSVTSDSTPFALTNAD